MPVALDTLFGKAHVSSLARKGGKGEPESVGPEFIYYTARIDHITPGFRHLLALSVPDDSMNINIAERRLPHKFQPHHDHPRDPEEKDIKSGYKDACGIEGLQVFGVAGPAESGKRQIGRAHV